MYQLSQEDEMHYSAQRWIAKMTAVEIHAIWERYVEQRLVTALNHSPHHFLQDNDVKGVKRVSAGLALYLVRGGGKYFDFRSMSDLFAKADAFLGRDANPFRNLPARDRGEDRR